METRGPSPDWSAARMVKRKSIVGPVAGDLVPAETQDVLDQLGSEPAKLAIAHHPACAPEFGPPVIPEQRKEAGSVFLGHLSRLDPEVVFVEVRPLPLANAKRAPMVVNVENRKLLADPQ